MSKVKIKLPKKQEKAMPFWLKMKKTYERVRSARLPGGAILILQGVKHGWTRRKRQANGA
ncbi:MAG: hypothetical protein ILA34_07115 [Bacteroidaceae bacterium]|nr:hypothetical protein [Bacteroidaceae bacterium]